jgi:hypothetical protein
MDNQEQSENRSEPQVAVVGHLNFLEMQNVFNDKASEINERIKQLENSQIVSQALLDLVVSL